MIGIYFSGTGNTKYCVNKFLDYYEPGAQAFSIEDSSAEQAIKDNEEILVAYPIQYSNAPKIIRDYMETTKELWRNKKVFIMVTMGLFSGDGAGVMARILGKYGAIITGGLHVTMPDSICDEKALKHTLEENKKIVKEAEEAVKKAATDLKNGHPAQNGMGLKCHLIGLFGQRLYFFGKTENYSSRLKISRKKCIGCGKCVDLCPMKNLKMIDDFVAVSDRCTMCYRCISQCPQKAITLLGKKVVEQCSIEKYI